MWQREPCYIFFWGSCVKAWPEATERQMFKRNSSQSSIPTKNLRDWKYILAMMPLPPPSSKRKSSDVAGSILYFTCDESVVTISRKLQSLPSFSPRTLQTCKTYGKGITFHSLHFVCAFSRSSFTVDVRSSYPNRSWMLPIFGKEIIFLLTPSLMMGFLYSPFGNFLAKRTTSDDVFDAKKLAVRKHSIYHSHLNSSPLKNMRKVQKDGLLLQVPKSQHQFTFDLKAIKKSLFKWNVCCEDCLLHSRQTKSEVLLTRINDLFHADQAIVLSYFHARTYTMNMVFGSANSKRNNSKIPLALFSCWDLGHWTTNVRCTSYQSQNLRPNWSCHFNSQLNIWVL